MSQFRCKVCAAKAEPLGGTDYVREMAVRCERCGEYRVTDTSDMMLPTYLNGDPLKIARVSFGLRRMQGGDQPPLLTSDLLTRLVEETDLPTPREQANNLILWLGKNNRGYTAKSVNFPVSTWAGIVGATTESDASAILVELKSEGLVDFPPGVRLTLEGWDRFFELEREVVESRQAFMAMPFNDHVLDRVFLECFKPSVKQTGFTLQRIDEETPAGLIDNRMRVEIRRSRFLIAELTHGNQGAYWEAGFAEGLGRPVIYTCNATHFNERRTHFDTNHCHTICWHEDNLEEASKQLKSTIRATLPAEAIPPTDDDE